MKLSTHGLPRSQRRNLYPCQKQLKPSECAIHVLPQSTWCSGVLNIAQQSQDWSANPRVEEFKTIEPNGRGPNWVAAVLSAIYGGNFGPGIVAIRLAKAHWTPHETVAAPSRLLQVIERTTIPDSLAKLALVFRRLESSWRPHQYVQVSLRRTLPIRVTCAEVAIWSLLHKSDRKAR